MGPWGVPKPDEIYNLSSVCVSNQLDVPGKPPKECTSKCTCQMPWPPQLATCDARRHQLHSRSGHHHLQKAKNHFQSPETAPSPPSCCTLRTIQLKQDWWQAKTLRPTSIEAIHSQQALKLFTFFCYTSGTLNFRNTPHRTNPSYHNCLIQPKSPKHVWVNCHDPFNNTVRVRALVYLYTTKREY